MLTYGQVQMTIAAMVTSCNPSLVARQTSGTDSEEVGPLLRTVAVLPAVPSVAFPE